jgi:hypothetical protein
MRFQKQQQIAWSGPAPVGPSYSGAQAMAAGLLPLAELVKWLQGREEMKGKGRITAQRVREATMPEEEHHWRDSRGSVKMVGFYRPEKALADIIELEDLF